MWDTKPEPMVIAPLDPKAWDMLDLTPQDIEPVVDEAEQQFNEVFSMLFTENLIRRSAN